MRASAHKFSQKVIGEAGLRLLSTVFVLYLARAIGAEEFGHYSTAMAYAALCIVFVDLGTNSILTREIARHPGDKIHVAQASHFLKLAASLGSWLVLWGITHLLHFQTLERYLTLCLGIVVIGQTLTDYFSALLNGIEEMGWEATLKVLSRALGLSLGFLSLARHQTLPVIVTYMAIGTLIGYAASAWIVKNRFTSFGIAVDIAFLKSLLRSSLPLFGSVIFWILYDSQDILLLNYFRFPSRDIGHFAAAMKIIDVVRVYPVLLLGVFFPTLSKLHLSDPPGFERKRRRLFLFMLASLAAIAGALYLSSPWIIRLLYKSDFMPSTYYLRLLAPALVLMGLNYAQVQFLIALNREQKLFAAAFLACGVNLFLAVIFLPRFGVPGTCYALLGSEAAYFLFLRYTMTSNT